MEQRTVSTLVNPCVRVREERGFAVPDWARAHRVNKLVIQQAEAACYSKPPPKVYVPYLSPEDYLLYNEFRTAKRTQNYSDQTFSDTVTFQELLEEAGNVFRLSLKLCVQYPEIHRIKTGKIYRLPAETRKALLDIGLTAQQLLHIESSVLIKGGLN